MSRLLEEINKNLQFFFPSHWKCAYFQRTLLNAFSFFVTNFIIFFMLVNNIQLSCVHPNANRKKENFNISKIIPKDKYVGNFDILFNFEVLSFGHKIVLCRYLWWKRILFINVWKKIMGNKQIQSEQLKSYYLGNSLSLQMYT